MRRLALLAAATACAAAAGCSLTDDADESRPQRDSTRAQPSRQAVLYTIGASNDPYGNGSPRGFGVVVGLRSAKPRTVERRDATLGWFGGAEWVNPQRILVPRKAPPLRRPLMFTFDGRSLRRAGVSPLPVRDLGYEWSPDARLIASQSVGPCEPNQRRLYRCYRQLPPVYVQRADGSRRRQVARGAFNGWSPDGRLLVTDQQASRFWLLDVTSGARTLALDPAAVRRLGGGGSVGLGAPRWSADGKYLAAYAHGDWPKPERGPKPRTTIVIATSDGRPLALIHSPYVISMFAWSPRGHRLAYTTSGFPDPHELFVIDTPKATPRRIFWTAHRHFDWLAWSPEATTLLVDDKHTRRWRLLDARSGAQLRTLPRVGGRPLWCCPVNAYTTVNG